jgi:hypothetical protein
MLLCFEFAGGRYRLGDSIFSFAGLDIFINRVGAGIALKGVINRRKNGN